MRPDLNRRPRSLSNLERLEERLAMNAEPIYDFWASADPSSEAEDLTTLAVTTPYANQQTGVNDVRNNYGFTGSGQTVAVIDTGIAWDHYALGRGYGENYRVVGGWDFAENDADPYDDGPAGFHGTHVSGIIGSSDSKYSGVATGVDFVGLRVFNDQGAGKFEWVEQALRWVYENRNAFENPITTVNLSIGAKWNAETLPNWATLEDELKQLYDAGIFISVAAGNDFATYGATGLSYPAVSQYVVAVGSVTSAGVFSSFSQRADRILAAPGQGITSSVPDWFYGGNGIANDYGAANGTSMAAPFVAGASVLVREAMEFVGYTNITQETIYNQLRNTADVFYDTVTKANYYKINVGRAIDSLMGPDDIGNTAATGKQLGTLGNDTTLTGVIGQRGDVDSFTFTAGVSGKVTLSAAVREKLSADIQILGATAQNVDGKLSFSITAGQQYTIQIGSKAGIGHYTLDVDIVANRVEAPPPASWGSISFAQFNDQRIAGEASFQFTASRTGILTIETQVSAGGNVRMELVDAQQRVVANVNAAGNSGRIDLNVTSGGSYVLRVIGQASDVDFRLTNLVVQSGNTVSVFGTAGNDVFQYTAGAQHAVDINGVAYRFDTRMVTNVAFSGQGGADTARLTGSAQNEVATITPGSAMLAGASFRVSASGVSNIHVDGAGGSDLLNLTGTAGNDLLVLSRGDAALTGAGFTFRGLNFSTVNVQASGGTDEARLTDTIGNDRFAGYSTYAVLQGTGYLHTVRGFDRVIVTSIGGDDAAYLYDTAGNDEYVARPTEAWLTGVGYMNKVIGFDRVFATATQGDDVATFYDSVGNDRFYGRPTVSWLTGTGFYNSAAGFDRTIANSTAGGLDFAYLYDSAGNDTYIADARQSLLRGSGFENTVQGFANVFAYATTGGDIAQFFDSSGNDTFVTGKSASVMSGLGYYNSASNFQQVTTTSRVAVNQAFFQELGASDSASETTDSSVLARARLTELLVGFDFATAKSKDTKAETLAIDYLFAKEGQE